MSAKHTPGPWSVKSDPCHFDTLSSVTGGSDNGKGWTTLMVEIGGLAKVDEQEANARLIAAAPELLEMLERCEMWLSAAPDGRAMQLACQAVIVKATGKEEA
jgi:hypothetical protein